MTAEAKTPQDAEKAGQPPARRRRRRLLRPVKLVTIVSHRWLSLVLGLVLLVITTTGAAVVYAPEWVKWTNSPAFQVTTSAAPIGVPDAMRIVGKAHPDFKPASVNVYDGLYEVGSGDTDKYPGFYGVDPGSGRITGYVNPDAGFMALMEQVHECFFTCDDYPAYFAPLSHPMPTLGTHWLKNVTVAGFVLGVFGLLLLFLALSGIWLWWPTLKRFGNGFRVRTGKGRYARDYDLHQLIGIVAVPFLLIWGFTGASFEFHWVDTAFYAVTGGRQVPEDSFASLQVRGKTADITPDQALAAAQAVAGPDARIANMFPPGADDQSAAYMIYFSRGFDQYRYGQYPGQYEVQVDRHDATRTHVTDLGAAPTLSNKVLDVYGAATLHYGESVNGWWRIAWFLSGLTPLALAITGVSTWLAKRSVRKRRRRAAAAA